MTDAGAAGAPLGQQQVLGGRYRLVRRLAEGGMATVWEGRDEILARPVAVKIPHAQLAVDEAFRLRFRREAVAAARLAHPGIVATYDTGADGPTDFIVMELVPGRTVRDLIADGPVAPEVAVPLVAQVAEALEVAHGAGLIHRDIKPANLLLLEDGPAPRVKVADFGVARAQEAVDRQLSAAAPVTREGVVVGTARYLAPEQVGARPVDGRTDVYATGCVLHEMLAGQPPFVRETDLAIALAHLTEAPPSLSSLGVHVEPVLERLVLACLAKDPAGRPASALLLAQQLRALAVPPASPPTAAVPLIELTPASRAGEPDPGQAATSAWAPAARLPVSVGGGGLGGSGHGSASGPAPATVALPVAGAGGAPRPGPPPRRPAPPALSPPRPTRHRTRAVKRPARSRVPLVVVGLLVLAALATALVVIAVQPDRAPSAAPTTAGSVVPGRASIADVRSFDPEADRRENDGQLPRLIDGNPTTTWSSDRYNLRPVFGNLKDGVGVVLVLDRPTRLDHLRVRSPSQAWAAQMYVADEPAASLPGWGQPVAKATGVEGDLDVDLGGKRGGAVLVWFTDPGRTGQIVVGEIELATP